MEVHMTAKKISRIHRQTESHWVGDGFPVSTMLYYGENGAEISPFLLLDYAGPADFPPAKEPRGVGQHPHRGFETVTIVYSGEVEHKDNAGNAGRIGPGDVQWMTAARGILHEEFQGREFTKNGGTLEMIQLWVNLPKKDKMSAPHYQEILNKNIPVVSLDGGAGTARIIAGNFGDTRGAAKTFTPVNLWDMRLKAGAKIDLPVPAGHNTMVLVLHGTLSLNDDQALHRKEIALLSPAGDTVRIAALEDATVLLMSGEPIDEPIVGQGPFVMNTPEEIRQAFSDFRSGRF
jgi:redox-sensitive bicupin YhaK (pirin superfamily)